MQCNICHIQHGDLCVENVEGAIYPVANNFTATLLGYDTVHQAIVKDGRCQFHKEVGKILEFKKSLT